MRGLIRSFYVGPGAMNRCLKMSRAARFFIFFVELSLLPAPAQIIEKSRGSVSQIQEEISRHPDNSELYVKLGLAFWDRNDYAHAFEASELHRALEGFESMCVVVAIPKREPQFQFRALCETGARALGSQRLR